MHGYELIVTTNSCLEGEIKSGEEWGEEYFVPEEKWINAFLVKILQQWCTTLIQTHPFCNLKSTLT